MHCRGGSHQATAEAQTARFKAAKRWAEAAEAARKEDLLRAKMCSLRRFKALFFHSRRKEKVRQETEAKRWPRRRRRKQRFEIMNEADERESMAALEQRDGSQVEGAVASANFFETGFFWKNFRGIKKGPTRGPIGEGRCRQSEPARR